jgi:hypothetical protein
MPSHSKFATAGANTVHLTRVRAGLGWLETRRAERALDQFEARSQKCERCKPGIGIAFTIFGGAELE